MSTALTTLTSKLASRLDMGDGSGLIDTLKATAFKGQVSDAQMTALMVVARHVEIADSGCWEWVGALASGGYGQLTHKGRHQTAHRFSYEHLVGPIPSGLWVLHRCDNRLCVNPTHLYAGTPANNRADMLDRDRWSHPWAKRTHCSKGHEYATSGFSIAKDGSRVCKVCQRDHKRNQRAENNGV